MSGWADDALATPLPAWSGAPRLATRAPQFQPRAGVAHPAADQVQRARLRWEVELSGKRLVPA